MPQVLRQRPTSEQFKAAIRHAFDVPEDVEINDSTCLTDFCANQLDWPQALTELLTVLEDSVDIDRTKWNALAGFVDYQQPLTRTARFSAVTELFDESPTVTLEYIAQRALRPFSPFEDPTELPLSFRVRVPEARWKALFTELAFQVRTIGARLHKRALTEWNELIPLRGDSGDAYREPTTFDVMSFIDRLQAQ